MPEPAWTELNQLTSVVRVASVFRSHSSPNCNAKSWLRYGASPLCGGMFVVPLTQRDQGSPAVAPINEGLEVQLQLIEV